MDTSPNHITPARARTCGVKIGFRVDSRILLQFPEIYKNSKQLQKKILAPLLGGGGHKWTNGPLLLMGGRGGGGGGGGYVPCAWPFIS